MKATKHTITITVEVLSIDAAPAIINDMVDNLRQETIEGSIIKTDGDKVSWSTKSEKVDF